MGARMVGGARAAGKHVVAAPGVLPLAPVKRRHLVLTAWLACHAGATAQVVTATAAAADLQVTCTGGPLQSIAAGTDLTGGGSVATQGTTAYGTASATTTLLPLVIGAYQVRPTLQCDVAASINTWFTGMNAACGYITPDPVLLLRPHNDVLVTLNASGPVRGRFVVAFASPLSTLEAIYAVDIGDDGTFEIGSAVLPPTPPVSFGPGALAVRLASVAFLSVYERPQALAAHTDLTLRFVPDSGCTAVETAPACTSLQLTPQPNFTLGIDQLVDHLLPPGGGIAAVVYGFQPAATPLPLPPGCTLATEAAEVRLLFADPAGHASHSIATVPAALRPCAFFAQAVEFDLANGTLATSSAFRIDCR
jgi:hypothetical protein